MHPSHPISRVEAPTLALIALTYVLWGVSLVALPFWLALPALVLILTLHSSLNHEVLHGHPTPWRALNTALVRPGLGLFIPYGRFRDTHLAHHMDENLTDPYDDPESNFQDPKTWARLPAWLQAVLRGNNTLLGRMTLGPVIGTFAFLRTDFGLIRAGDRGVLRSWLAHILWTAPVIILVYLSGFPLWAYALAAVGALSVLRIRTYLEHRAHKLARARTVVIEDRGPLAFLFLNNNFHVVHHMHPAAPWYRLPAIYFANSAHYLRRNEGYRYVSYAQIFYTYFLRVKDPVPHPLRPLAPLDLAD